MFRRSLFPLVFVHIVVIQLAFAQISVQGEDMDGPGITWMQYRSDVVTVNPGTAGVNQAWTFPAVAWSDSEAIEIFDPASTAFADSFPTAARAQHWTESDEGTTRHTYVFEGVIDDGWYWLGMGRVENSVALALPLHPPSLSCPLPLTYGVPDWSTVYTRIASEDMMVHDSTRWTVDGWGTLTTPFGTYDVLRMYGQNYLTVYGPEDTTTTENSILAWLDGQGMRVVHLESEAGTSGSDFTQARVLMCYRTPATVEPARGPLAERFRVGQNYPNPFNPTTSLPVELSKASRVSLAIYNEAGQRISAREFDLAAGSHTLPIDGHAWSTGTYFARVSIHGQSATTKVQLVK